MHGLATTWFPISPAPSLRPAFLASWQNTASAVRCKLTTGNNEGTTTKTITVAGNGSGLNSTALFVQAVSDPLTFSGLIAWHGLIRMRADMPDVGGKHLGFAYRSMSTFRIVNSSGATVVRSVSSSRLGPASDLPPYTSVYFVDSAMRAFGSLDAYELNWKNGNYNTYAFSAGDRFVIEYGVNLYSYTGTLNFSMEYGHVASQGLLSYASQTAPGNGFFEVVNWADPGVLPARYSRPKSPTHRPDRIRYPSIAPIGDSYNARVLNGQPYSLPTFAGAPLNAEPLNARSLNN